MWEGGFVLLWLCGGGYWCLVWRVVCRVIYVWGCSCVSCGGRRVGRGDGDEHRVLLVYCGLHVVDIGRGRCEDVGGQVSRYLVLSEGV